MFEFGLKSSPNIYFHHSIELFEDGKMVFVVQAIYANIKWMNVYLVFFGFSFIHVIIVDWQLKIWIDAIVRTCLKLFFSDVFLKKTTRIDWLPPFSCLWKHKCNCVKTLHELTFTSMYKYLVLFFKVLLSLKNECYWKFIYKNPSYNK